MSADLLQNDLVLNEKQSSRMQELKSLKFFSFLGHILILCGRDCV